MAVPDYQSVMLPLLRFAEERKTEISTDDAVEALAAQERSLRQTCGCGPLSSPSRTPAAFVAADQPVRARRNEFLVSDKPATRKR